MFARSRFAGGYKVFNKKPKLGESELFISPLETSISLSCVLKYVTPSVFCVSELIEITFEKHFILEYSRFTQKPLQHRGFIPREDSISDTSNPV